MPKFSEKFNKTAFNVDTNGFEYCKLKELWVAAATVQPTYKLDALYINKSPLGETPLFIVAEIGKMVNMPSHLVGTCREILADAEAVETIKQGKVGFTLYEYEAKGKTCYGIKFVDIEPTAETAEKDGKKDGKK